MAYGQNDPATDRRISRLSLISSAANLLAPKGGTREDVLATAQAWESWIYGDGPVIVNGSVATVTPAPVLGPVCAECNAPLTEVQFKKGNVWSVDYLAQQGQAKYGRLLCKTHYFGKKPATA